MSVRAVPGLMLSLSQPSKMLPAVGHAGGDQREIAMEGVTLGFGSSTIPTDDVLQSMPKYVRVSSHVRQHL